MGRARGRAHLMVSMFIDLLLNAASVCACSASDALSSTARAAVIDTFAAIKLDCTAPKTARFAQAATGACSGGTSPQPEPLLKVAGSTSIPQGNGAYTLVCAACGANHSVPPMGSGSHERASITRLTMLWCLQSTGSVSEASEEDGKEAAALTSRWCAPSRR